jgi:hypothetical protein
VLEPERGPGDDEDEDRIDAHLPADARAVAPADDLAALVEPHRVDVGLLVAREALFRIVLLEGCVRADRRRGGGAEVLGIAVAALVGGRAL